MKTLHQLLSTAISLAFAARTASVASPTAVDLAGFDGAMIQVITGVITDGTHTIGLEESADNSAWTAVAAADIVGSKPVLDTTAAHDNAVFEFGYIGSKRYIRVPVVVAGTTTGGVYGATVVRGFPRKAPA